MQEGVTVVAFSVGAARYGVDVSDVLAVVPRATARPLDGTPPWVEGLMPVSGGLVPLIDLVRLQTGVPARRAFSTRVVLVRYRVGGGEARPLGLVAERVTDIASVETGSIQPTGVLQAGSPWLGDVGRLAGGTVVQLVTVSALLTDEVRALLFVDNGRKG